ncbi:lysophospholipid acyltransferase family protein [Klugiella xanthotipulae]|uniref:1-acyl-sn-glycerol-3-phosphate acyltransferase n=1 Tax=Klugiella xanthotipulae TaxID=244735 RepID=A0A543HRU4_9MICO|nr:lysophospholipid acyltransferase family protein [Klugiella xanthotipulae]TQM61042.1 1-acyl-sn-glycerol-3-phosphate acyltransferase [Klugiella xanthotipulae]
MPSPQKASRPRSPEKSRPSIFWLLASIVLPLWALMVRYRFVNSEKLPAQGPFVLAPNHYSEIDPIVMGVAVWKLGRQPRFMAKASLFKIPVVGWMLRTSGQIPVERAGGGSSQPIRAAQQLVVHGQGLIVYPEGSLTREPDLWPMRGKSGAVRLALENDIPLIPSAHWGTQELMPRYGKNIHPFPRKRISVIIGDPVDLSDLAGQVLDQKTLAMATDRLMAAISDLLGELRSATPPPERWDPARNNQTETGKF